METLSIIALWLCAILLIAGANHVAHRKKTPQRAPQPSELHSRDRYAVADQITNQTT